VRQPSSNYTFENGGTCPVEDAEEEEVAVKQGDIVRVEGCLATWLMILSDFPVK
jgi:hypothetical protein